MIYALGVALAAGAGFVIIAHGDYTSPIVYVAISYLSTILGVHINLIGSSSAATAQTLTAVDPATIAQDYLSGAAASVAQSATVTPAPSPQTPPTGQVTP